MRKVVCKNEGCERYYDSLGFPDNDWTCVKCSSGPSRLFDRKKKNVQSMLKTDSTNRTRLRYWMRWLREQQ